MKRLGEQDGFTLIEMLVGLTIMLVVLGGVVGVLEVFQNDYRKDQIRNETQDSARNAIDQMSRDFRSAASLCGVTTGTTCTGSSSGVLQRSLWNDAVFQIVEPVTTFGSNDSSNQEWIRYCLDSSSGSLYREILAPSGSSALASMPTTTSCPGDTSSWPTQRKIVTNLTNTSTSPLFQYYNISTSSGGTVVQLAKSIEFDLLARSNTTPNLITEITGGVDMRNSLASPTASFNCTSTGTVTCDASGSSDPNGQSLEYAWYLTSGTATSCSGAVQASTQTYSAGALSGSYTVALQVTDSAGLNNCTYKAYSF